MDTELMKGLFDDFVKDFHENKKYLTKEEQWDFWDKKLHIYEGIMKYLEIDTEEDGVRCCHDCSVCQFTDKCEYFDPDHM